MLNIADNVPNKQKSEDYVFGLLFNLFLYLTFTSK